MRPLFTLRTPSRRAVFHIAGSTCLMAGMALAAHPALAQAPAAPAGYVWQGTYQDGRWTGQWIPGQGISGPAQGVMPPGNYAPPPMADRDMPRHMRHMLERCGDDRYAHDRDCAAFYRDHPEFASAPGYAPGYNPMPYAPLPYGQMAYGQSGYGTAPMGVPPGMMMVPVIQGQQAPCFETRTVTTEYVDDGPRRIARARPYHKDKRVYTGE